MQTLINFPSASTPTQSHQELSTATVPLQISKLGSSHSKVAKVLHYGDAFLDDLNVFNNYDLRWLECIISCHRKEEAVGNYEEGI